jgi:hypothetical protein
MATSPTVAKPRAAQNRRSRRRRKRGKNGRVIVTFMHASANRGPERIGREAAPAASAEMRKPVTRRLICPRSKTIRTDGVSETANPRMVASR